MDRHNNAIGYDHKYRDFRGRWIRDRYDWKLWSRKVRDYVNAMDGSEPKNGVKMEWREDNEPSSLAVARQEMAAEGVKNSQYVFYN